MKSKIENIAREYLQDTSAYIVEIEESAKKMSIFLDGFNGVDIRTCSRLAKRINRASEEDTAMQEYSFEVSSVGIGQNINTEAQLKSNVGRRVKVNAVGEESKTGRMIAVDDKKVFISKEKELISYLKEEIESVKVEIEF